MSSPITDEQLWGAPPRPLKLPPGMRWQARDREGVGHLLPRTNAAVSRYLCNRMPVNDRFAWPVLSRCPECVRLLEEGR